MSVLAKEWLATPAREDHFVEITQSDFYAGMVKIQGEIYNQLLAMDPKFVPSDYGLRDRLPESYDDYLSSTAAPPPVVHASPSLEPALDTIPLDIAYLDSAGNATDVVSMQTSHRDGIASNHLTIPETGEDATQQAPHPAAPSSQSESVIRASGASS